MQLKLRKRARFPVLFYRLERAYGYGPRRQCDCAGCHLREDCEGVRAGVSLQQKGNTLKRVVVSW
jgi:hypothetical protein